jgi:hypothetical protein
VVYLSKSYIVYKANSGIRERVNKDIAFLYNINSYRAVLPFIKDYTLDSPPKYPNPRSLTYN